MKKTLIQNSIQKIRACTPLSLRRSIGPWIALLVYNFNLYVNKNYKRPKVLSINDTIDLVIKKKLSVVRFGDGEMSLIGNCDLSFQNVDQELNKKLALVLQSNLSGLLVCIPGIWGDIRIFTKRSYWFVLHHLFKYGPLWYSLLSFDRAYGDAHITRPYLAFVDKTNCGQVFKKLFLIWKDQDVILIEGEKSRLGVGNDMFDNVRSLQRILCPAEDAFLKYDQIKSEAIKIPKNKIILISLGPTAKPLTYDLFLLGYRVIDIGHIDMEYEMFLRKETQLVKVEYKYFNELNERNPEVCDDPKYMSQIIARIV
jgi:glycosyltransferase family protein